MADNRQQDARLRGGFQEQVNAGTPAVKVGGGIVIDSRVGFDVAEAVEQHGSALFQMPDGFAGGNRAPIFFLGNTEKVAVRVGQCPQEGDIAADEVQVVAAQLGGDDQAVVCPGVVRDHQQRAFGRETLRPAGCY
ncbi:MAG: hypothetical protein V2A34_16130 [Lentisphaerota bacterium]